MARSKKHRKTPRSGEVEILDALARTDEGSRARAGPAEPSDLREFWTRLAPILRSAREKERCILRRATEGALARASASAEGRSSAAAGRSASPLQQVPSRAWAWFRRARLSGRPAWGWGLAAASGVGLTIVGLSALMLTRPTDRGTDLGTSGGGEFAEAASPGGRADETLPPRLAPGAPETLYVAFDADRRGAGTEAEPFGSLAEAVAASPPGTTVILRGGVSRERLRVSKALTLVSAGGPVRIGEK